MGQKDLKLSDDKLISIAVVSYPLILAVQLFALIVMGRFGVPGAEYTLILSRIAVGFFFLLAFPSVVKRKRMLILRTYYAAMFIYLLHFLFFPLNRSEILLNAPAMFIYNLPSFIYVSSIVNYEYFKKLLYRVGFIIFLMNLYLSVMVVLGHIYIPTYSMSLSYYIMISAIMFFDNFIENLEKRDFILFLISILIMLSFGSRGAIIGIAFFVVYKVLRIKNYTIQHAFLKFTVILGTAFVTIFYEVVLRTLQILLTYVGISSRTLNSFLSTQISLSGRDVIYSTMIGRIIEKPIVGYGLYGDTVLRGNYVHNIFLEIILNYGLIIGLLLIGSLVVLLVKALFTAKPLHADIIAIYFCVGLVPLFVSYSYLSFVNFWVFLGLVIQINKKSGRREITK